MRKKAYFNEIISRGATFGLKTMHELDQLGKMRADQFWKWLQAHLEWAKEQTPENAKTALQERVKYDALAQLEEMLIKENEHYSPRQNQHPRTRDCNEEKGLLQRNDPRTS